MILARWQSFQSINELNREKLVGVFQNQGVCRQAFPSFLSPNPFLSPFYSRPIFRAARMWKTPLRGPNFVRSVWERLLRRLHYHRRCSYRVVYVTSALIKDGSKSDEHDILLIHLTISWSSNVFDFEFWQAWLLCVLKISRKWANYRSCSRISRNKLVISRIMGVLSFMNSRQLKIGVHDSRKNPLPTLFWNVVFLM